MREAEGFLGRVARGDFTAGIEVPNHDEFGALARRMNEMSRELHQLYEDPRRAATQLRTLNTQLEQASRAKSDFLASTSHELRTPMNAILGFTEMVRDGLYGEVPPEMQEPMADIQTCGRQLLGLINNVLDLSKIEAGRMERAIGDYVVDDVVNTVTTSLRSRRHRARPLDHPEAGRAARGTHLGGERARKGSTFLFSIPARLAREDAARRRSSTSRTTSSTARSSGACSPRPPTD